MRAILLLLLLLVANTVESFLLFHPERIAVKTHSSALMAKRRIGDPTVSSSPFTSKGVKRSTSSTPGKTSTPGQKSTKKIHRRGGPKRAAMGSNWRIFNIENLLADDPGKDDHSVNEGLFSEVMRYLGVKEDDIEKEKIDTSAITVVKKSFDGRWKKDGQPKFVYTVDVSFSIDLCRKLKLRHKEGKIELLPAKVAARPKQILDPSSIPRVVIVGAGPAG